MNIPKAIKIKEAYHKKYHKHMLSSEREADRLSLEALKFRLKLEQEDPEIELEPLPGETKD